MIKRLLMSGSLAAALLVTSTACVPAAPGTPAPAGSARLEAHTVARAKLEPISRFPAREHMAADVRMYLPRRRGSYLEVDTLAGPVAVSRWLAASRVQEGPDRLFELHTRRLYVCEGALVQAGTYWRRDPQMPGRRDLEHRFLARWVPEGEEWRLSDLWMRQSLTTVSVSDLAPRCWAPPPAWLARTGARLGKTGAAGVVVRPVVYSRPRPAGAVDGSIMEWSVVAHRNELAANPTVAAEAFARILPRWTAILTGEAAGEVELRASAYNERLTLTLDRWSVGALLGRDVSVLRVAAGPAVTRFDWTWRSEPTLFVGEERMERSGSTVWGLLTQVDLLMMPVRSLLTQASVRYGFHEPVEVPLMSHHDWPSADAEMSGLTISLGIGYALTP